MPLAIIIPADETKEMRLEVLEGLDDYQKAVGGNIETIPYMENVAPYFNEEGKLLGLPRNDLATTILADCLMPGDYIAGDCVFVGFDPNTGEERDIVYNRYSAFTS